MVGMFFRALAIVVLVLSPWAATAQISIQGKQCNRIFVACESKCQPLIKQVPGGQWKQNKEGSKCRSKCALDKNKCNAARPPASPAAPECRVSSDCARQPDGAPVLCRQGRCLAT